MEGFRLPRRSGGGGIMINLGLFCQRRKPQKKLITISWVLSQSGLPLISHREEERYSLSEYALMMIA